MIAWEHKDCHGQSLTQAPWLILSPEALTPELIEEVIHRSQGIPLTITETPRCIIRELGDSDLSSLCRLQEENKNNPAGCFFPESCAEPDVYLNNYIKCQYPFYGFGLFGIYIKSPLSFAGIAGFYMTNLPDCPAGISYSLLKKHQHQGYAREAIKALLIEGRKRWQLTRVAAEIHPTNTASLTLAEAIGIPTIQTQRLPSQSDQKYQNLSPS